MARAGQKLRAADLSFRVEGRPLTDTSLSSSGVWRQWGGETITLDDPGVPVDVLAQLTGSFVNTSSSSSDAFARIAVSLDGGSTWITADAPGVTVGGGSGNRGAALAQTVESGTPTGQIMIRGELFVNSTNTEGSAGYLTALVSPSGVDR